MTSFLARIQDVRQPAPTLEASPVAPTPEAAPLPPAETAHGTYVMPEPAKPAESSEGVEILSYLLNPPLPTSARRTSQEEDETPPVRNSSVRKPRARTRPSVALTVVPKKPRAKPISEKAVPTIPKLEELPMKTQNVIYARSPKTNATHAGPAPRMPDPEGSLAWLQFLCKNVHPGGLHMMLAYYRRLGWIPAGSYAWLRDLCDGIARQSRNLTWDSLRITPDELVKIHAQSYRWLQAMFPPVPATPSTTPANSSAIVVKKMNAARRAEGVRSS